MLSASIFSHSTPDVQFSSASSLRLLILQLFRITIVRNGLLISGLPFSKLTSPWWAPSFTQ